MFEELQEGIHKVANWYATEAYHPEVDPNLIVSAQVKTASYIASIGAQEITARRAASQAKIDYEFEYYTALKKLTHDLTDENGKPPSIAKVEQAAKLTCMKLKEELEEAEDNHHAWKQFYSYSKILWEQLRSHLSYLKEQMGNE